MEILRMTKSMVVVAAVLGISGCNGLQNDATSIEAMTSDESLNVAVRGSGKGKMKLLMTKTAGAISSDSVEMISAKILVVGVEVRDLAGNHFNFSPAPFSLDLVKLREGLGLTMLRLALPPGEYDQVRLVTSGLGQIQMADASTLEFRIPSAEQSGLKIFIEPALVIASDSISVAVVEADLSKSFVFQGNGGVLFKPVLRVRMSAPIPIESNPAEVIDPAEGEDPVGDSGSDPAPIDENGETVDLGGVDGGANDGGATGEEPADTGTTEGGTDPSADPSTDPVVDPIIDDGSPLVTPDDQDDSNFDPWLIGV